MTEMKPIIAGDQRPVITREELETLVREQMRDVLPAAGEEIVEADDFVAVLKKPVAKVGAEEAGAAGDEDSHIFDLGFSIFDRRTVGAMSERVRVRTKIENLNSKIVNYASRAAVPAS